DFRDNPRVWTLLPGETHSRAFFQDHIYDLHRPENFEYAIELRKLIDEYSPPRFLVGEIQGTLKQLRDYYGPNNNGLNSVFLFPFSSIRMDPAQIHKIVSNFEELLPPPYIPTWVYSNHDRMRMISRFSDDPPKAKVMTTLQLTLRGVPYIYQGEEIGMPQVKFSKRKSEDPVARKYWWIPFTQSKRFGFSLTRDGCRTPMQWSAGPNAGFSPNPDAVPWLKISKSYKKINVESQKEEPNSLFNFYKRLLKIRRENIALTEGILQLEPPDKKSLIYYRLHPSQKLAILLNFSKKPLSLKPPLKDSKLIFSTNLSRYMSFSPQGLGPILLEPFEAMILEGK
ncbi:MAG: alpha-amylase family glycosyl hydrolase, partial [Candidatus Helarchaeota archaeon]